MTKCNIGLEAGKKKMKRKIRNEVRRGSCNKEETIQTREVTEPGNG
jgi:hypothetical protein